MPFVHPSLRPRTALLVLGGLVLLPGLASAAAARIVKPVTDAPPAATAAPTAPQGSRAIPVTPGEIAMRETAPGVYEGIIPRLMPDGSWLVHLDERFHSFSVMRRGDGGRLTGACVHGAAGLAQWRTLGKVACAHDHAVRPAVSGPQATTVTKWEAR